MTPTVRKHKGATRPEGPHLSFPIGVVVLVLRMTLRAIRMTRPAILVILAVSLTV